jgi:hypothetical protein
VAETHRGKEENAAARAVVAMIRQGSEKGQLISDSEILQRLTDQHLLASLAADPSEEMENFLKRARDENEDIEELSVADGSRQYYSSNFMTEAYALILLQKQGGSLPLIAATVRQNSAVYNRPVPADIFTQQPFGLPLQEVMKNLGRMETEAQYQDIVSTTTSTSRVFLYSTLHLEPEYASMLAEWLDVGQFENP